MAARYERRRRIVPIPRTIPTIPAASPYVPLIRPPPGMPWSATQSNLLEIESFYHLINMPQRSAVLTTPYNSPRELPLLADENQANHADRPVWPPQSSPTTHGPPNRPALPRWWEPGTFPVQPFNTVVPLRLHPHIIVNPMNSSIPILQWDILHRAEQARIYTGRQVIVSADLGAQAVLPNVSKIYISSDRYPLVSWIEGWGPIMVEKPSITIRDILDAIYEYFQKPLTRREFRRINELPSNAARLTISAMKRASASHELYSVGLESGFRRVDVMGSHRRFQGLRLVVFQDNTWKLFLELLPLAGPVPLTS